MRCCARLCYKGREKPRGAVKTPKPEFGRRRWAVDYDSNRGIATERWNHC
jgi:hypothetical protein